MEWPEGTLDQILMIDGGFFEFIFVNGNVTKGNHTTQKNGRRCQDDDDGDGDRDDNFDESCLMLYSDWFVNFFFICSYQFPTMQQIGEDLVHVLDQLKWVNQLFHLELGQCNYQKAEKMNAYCYVILQAISSAISSRNY